MLSTYMLCCTATSYWITNSTHYQMGTFWCLQKKHPINSFWYKFTIYLIFCVCVKTEKTLNIWIIFWMKQQYCKHVMCRTCMQHRQCMPCQRRERLCATERLIQFYLSLLVSQTPSLGSDAPPPQPLGDTIVIPMKTACMQSK